MPYPLLPILLIIAPRFSVLPALALNDRIIHCDIIKGAFDTNTFYSFISHLLDEMQPYAAPKSVVVMDNCRIHKHPEILRLIESRYALILHFWISYYLSVVCAMNFCRP